MLDCSSNFVLFLFLFYILISLFLFLDDNENYVDDWCLGHLLQGMCYRCVNKPKEAMESLLNAVNRSVFAKLSLCSEPAILFRNFTRAPEKAGETKGQIASRGVYLRDTEILLTLITEEKLIMI